MLETPLQAERGAGRYTLNIVQSTLSIGPNLCWVRQQREPTPRLALLGSLGNVSSGLSVVNLPR